MGSAASIKYRFKKKRTKNVFTCKLDGYDYDNQYPTCEYAYTRNFRNDNFTMTNDIIRFCNTRLEDSSSSDSSSDSSTDSSTDSFYYDRN